MFLINRVRRSRFGLATQEKTIEASDILAGDRQHAFLVRPSFKHSAPSLSNATPL